ncbi:hypothetical protein [Saccharothrix coeruleofusca]|uniref:hypothetical protein n=1 Tax=Saccharothrix coeruleofusca TaxID=33919 RepID=UPI0016701AC1|nr:hypothetical protein [Saccharothrix coeruleofusca]
MGLLVLVLLVAVGVVVAFLVLDGPRDRRATPTPTPTATPTGGGLPPPAGTTPAAAGNGTPSWAGDVRMGPGGLDLDANPAVPGDAGADIRKDHYTEVAPGQGAVAVEWPGPREPSFEECRGRVAGGSDVLLEPQVGGKLCVRTTEGRIAAMTHLGPDETGRFWFAVRVWDS